MEDFIILDVFAFLIVVACVAIYVMYWTERNAKKRGGGKFKWKTKL